VNFWAVDQPMISVTGVVTKVALVNPHPTVTLDVMEDGKKVVYVAVLRSGVRWLAGLGITDEVLTPGLTLGMEGYRPKVPTERRGIFVEHLTLPDGRKIKMIDSRDF
jgi:hypothetical protein